VKRRIHLIGFFKVPTSNFTGTWMHPFSATNLVDPALFQSVARTLEAGLFDMVFIPDGIVTPGTYGGDFSTTLRHGAQGSLELDPVVVLTSMAGVTTHLGLGATMSTTFSAPFNIARTLGTLDLVSGGRAAWNIVTSHYQAQARNFGADAIPPLAERYDRADELVGVVTDLWSSWDGDAMVIDRESGTFIDPTKVRYLHHDGAYLKVEGPLSIPPSPQGRPVLMQAGASERGLAFGARWGEVIFAIQHRAEDMRALRANLRERAALAGRDPETLLLMAAVQPILGETEGIAAERREYLRSIVSLPASLAVLSSHSGLDLADVPLSTPLEEVVSRIGGPQARGTALLLEQARLRGMRTLEEAVRDYGTSELAPQIVGTPLQVAEQLRELFVSEAADGFILTPPVMPGGFEEFARGVVPHLQRMGLYRTAYEGTTLRENLGLPPLG
jgi:FMN-dependent oxidoreductase (nitrilotriacetate monooxygenase family)